MAKAAPKMTKDDQREWAHERLALDPEGEVTVAELERDLLMWASDRRLKPLYTGIGAMLANTGNLQRKLRPTRFVGLQILPLVDSGYRVPSQQV